MTQLHALVGADFTPDRPAVHKINLRDIRDALARGVADFSAMPSHAVFLCLIYPIVGLILARLIVGYAVLPLLFPLAAGFALVGPFAAIGFYELSRQREQGLEPLLAARIRCAALALPRGDCGARFVVAGDLLHLGCSCTGDLYRELRLSAGGLHS